MKPSTVRWIVVGDSGVPRIAEAPTLAVVTCAESEVSTVVPVDLPPYGAWIEVRESALWYVNSNRGLDSRFRRVQAADCYEAASLLGSECFVSMLVANALAGGASAGWALVRSGYPAEKIIGFLPGILAPCRERAEAVVTALGSFADDATAANRRLVEEAFRRLQWSLCDHAGSLARPKTWTSRAAAHGETLDGAAAWGSNAVNSMGNDEIRPAYRTRHDPGLLRQMAGEWSGWALSLRDRHHETSDA